jgi:hypothetical protein
MKVSSTIEIKLILLKIFDYNRNKKSEANEKELHFDTIFRFDQYECKSAK